MPMNRRVVSTAMTSSGKVVEGVFAVNKPSGQSSAQVLRNLQTHFNPSALFAPWVAEEQRKRKQEPPHERRKRSRAKRASQVKLGHGGTLDPMATGVLIVGVGRGTKELPTFLGCTKTYETVVLFGAATDSYDILGKVVARKSSSQVTEGAVRAALDEFRGKGMQTPPIFSALWQDGKRLYEYARAGEELPRAIEQREVNVSSLEMVEWLAPGLHNYHIPASEADSEAKEVAEKLIINPVDAPSDNDERKRKHPDSSDAKSEAGSPKRARHANVDQDPTPDGETTVPENASTAPANPEASPTLPSTTTTTTSSPPTSTEEAPAACRIRMTVSSGFYVRSFCHDLGRRVGSLGLMAALVRSRQAGFELGENVFEYDDFEKGEDAWAPKVESLIDSWNAGEIERPEK